MAADTKIDRMAISRCVEHLLSLPNATIEKHEEIAQAFANYQKGLDFADTLHLAASQGCQVFMTFDDKRFARRAQRLNCLPEVRVLNRLYRKPSAYLLSAWLPMGFPIKSNKVGLARWLG
jgi:hypothetical protein